ncbi:MAG: hypothetical protein AAF205_01070 [Pseudomonadota bacterium]
MSWNLDQRHRGYRISYRMDAVNYCPGCSRSQWYVGRLTAECAFCDTVLPLARPPAADGHTFGDLAVAC